MKKVLMFVLAAIISVAFASVGFTQDKPAAPPADKPAVAAPEKAKDDAAKETKKVKKHGKAKVTKAKKDAKAADDKAEKSEKAVDKAADVKKKQEPGSMQGRAIHSSFYFFYIKINKNAAARQLFDREEVLDSKQDHLSCQSRKEETRY